MAFKNRDDFLLEALAEGRITEDRLNAITREHSKVQEPTRTIVGYVGDIAAVLQKYRLDGEYGIFGGYAVLAHLVSRFGESVVSAWRGSNDIDMFGTVDVLNAFRGAYNILNDRPSPNIEDKLTLKIRVKEGNEEECKVDYILSPKDSQQLQTETGSILGVPVVVATPIELVRAKLPLILGERKQFADVESLLGVLDYRGMSARDVSESLTRQQAGQLYRMLVTLTEPGRELRITAGATQSYLVGLKQVLKSRA